MNYWIFFTFLLAISILPITTLSQTDKSDNVQIINEDFAETGIKDSSLHETREELEHLKMKAIAGRTRYSVGRLFTYASVALNMAAFSINSMDLSAMFLSATLGGITSIFLVQSGMISIRVAAGRADKLHPGSSLSDQHYDSQQQFILGEVCAFGAFALTTAGTPVWVFHGFPTASPLYIGTFACLIMRDILFSRFSNTAISHINTAQASTHQDGLEISISPLFNNKSAGLAVAFQW